MLSKHRNSARTGLREWFAMALLVAAIFAASVANAADAWVQIDAPGIDEAYVAFDRTTASFTHYRIEPIGYWHLADETDGFTVDFVKAALTDRFVALFEAAGLAPSDAAAHKDATTLVLRLQVVDLLLHPATHFEYDVASRYRFELAPGHMTLVGELGTGTGEALLRVADMRADAGITGWSGVASLVATWQGQFNAVLADTGLPSAAARSAALR